MINSIVVTSTVITAIATAVIAVLSVASFRLAKSLQGKSDQHEQEMKDLLNAMVIAQLSAPHGGESQSKGMMRFKQHYKGKTPILED